MNMKLSTFLIVPGLLIMSACSNDFNKPVIPSKSLPNAVVTVKTEPDTKRLYLQLDDSTTLLPVNVKASPYGDKQVRALVNVSEAMGFEDGYSRLVTLNMMDSILTKQIVPTTGSQDEPIFGRDAVDIVNDWITCVEDGYLTIEFRTFWGDTGIKHYVNLISGTDADSPYVVEFRHNANGDQALKPGFGIVAFDLRSLPPTNGKTVKLRLKWESYSGPRSITFDYNSDSCINTPSHPDGPTINTSATSNRNYTNTFE